MALKLKKKRKEMVCIMVNLCVLFPHLIVKAHVKSVEKNVQNLYHKKIHVLRHKKKKKKKKRKTLND